MSRIRLHQQLRQLITGPWSVRFILSALSLQTLALLALSLILLSWHSSRHSLLDAARSSAQQNSRIIALQLGHNLEAASALLRILSFETSLAPHALPSWQARLPQLAHEMLSNPFISAIYFGDQQGAFLSLRSLGRAELREQLQAPAQARLLVQQINPQRATPGSYLFYDDQLQLLEERSMPEYRFDPRQRDWYQQARAAAGVQATTPYVFFSTAQLGITLSLASPDGQNIFGLDMALDDLSQSLQQLIITPGTELAIVDRLGTLIAYPDLQRVLANTNNQPRAQHLRQLGVAPLTAIYDQADTTAAEDQWLGLSYSISDSPALYLLISTPTKNLLNNAYQARNRQLLLAVALSLMFFVISFKISGFIGQRMLKLLGQVQRITRFDFSPHPQVNNLVKESNQLEAITDKVSQTLQNFLEISQIVGSERDTASMLQQVLQRCVLATDSCAGLVYLQDEAQHARQLAAWHGLEPQQQLLADDKDPDCFWDVAASPELVKLQQFTFALKGRQGENLGVLALLRKDFHGNRQERLRFQSFVERLSGMLAVTIETHALIDSQRQLLDGVIRMLAGAIDAKSPYTSGHCQRVPLLAKLFVDQLQAQTQGPWADFKLNTQQQHAFFLASWLHDCGKLTTPEHIVDKPTKLSANYNRLHEVRMRFEVLWRDAQLEHSAAIAAGAPGQNLPQRLQQLQDDFAFVARCNLASESLSTADMDRLQHIGQQSWQRHFDDLLGLGHEELELRRQGRPDQPELPSQEQLLQDLDCHRIEWGDHRPAVEPGHPGNRLGIDMQLPALRHNLGELHNLCVQRGTLTEEDRFIVNNHIVQTLVMLSDLPWPKGLTEVPDIAANHHERMDGQGYPRKLQAGQLPLTHRILALADVFEALTAHDRPYKKGKPLSEALELMCRMCQQGHLDPELMQFFLHSSIWSQYAAQFLDAQQIDQPDLARLQARLDSLTNE